MAIKILNDLLPIAEQTEVGVVKPDNVSITITETGELQSSVVDLPDDVVTAENYDNPKLWKGTLEEYNAIETKDPLVTYIITDDNVETLKTTDYNALSNKPSINDVTLEGNKTLEELNIQPADTSLTTSQITNCITKIPQDIKLELTDGTLILKAGSKVYVPNGFEDNGMTPKFDEVTTSSDHIHNYGTAHTKGLLLLNLTGSTINGIEVFPHSFLFSGTSQPSGNLYIWYNTNNNIIKNYTNEVATNATISFPIAEFTGNGSQITSIKVFNGFGYIGSTIFALPGVEGLIPKGRNADGSLNNTKFTTTNVSIKTFTETADVIFTVYTPTGIPTATAVRNYYYNEDENYNYFDGNKSSLHFIYARGSFENGRITSFNPNTTFQMVNRNDTEWASTQGKPSNRYIDLTLGASGSTYTAPANGWITVVIGSSTQTNIHVNVDGPNLLSVNEGSEAISRGNFVPVKKGDLVSIYYAGTPDIFRFIYDEGVK